MAGTVATPELVQLALYGHDGAPWCPAELVPTLRRDSIVSDGFRLIALVERYWRTPNGQRVRLDDWQKWLILRALERYPDDWPVERLRGRLRFRQLVVSMGRQNGKSLLGGVFALYGLVQHVAGASVVGIATSVEQANVIYERVAYAVRNDPALSRKLKATGTRGIRHRDGSGSYMVKPALEEGLQSVPITLCAADELHLARPAMWDSVVNGQRAQLDALIVGITTAGDDTSELLKRLYDQGRRAVAASLDGDPARFGFFLWEAPEGATVHTAGAIEAANPAVACGRIDRETVLSDVAELPEPDQLRYTLNRFVAATDAWLTASVWHRLAAGGVPAGVTDVVFAIDRTPDWEHAAITATAKLDGRLHTELVASVPKPDPGRLADLCAKLAANLGGGTFAMETRQLSVLGAELITRGIAKRDVRMLAGDEVCQASAIAYAAIVKGRASHPDDPLTREQMPRARRRNVGEHWRLSRADSRVHIDAVQATVIGLYVADTKQPASMQLF